LVAYLLYMDAITTLTAFTAIYARDTIGLSLPQIISLFVISQFTAIPGSFVVGRLADRVGAKPTISGSLCVWLVIIALGVFARGYSTFVLIALLAGAGTGALQSVSRSFMAQLSPRDREAEFFGFYALVGRVSAIFGPLLFGAVSSLSGNQRPALASLIVLVAAGLVLFQRVQAPTPEAA
jgi:UMF1 family MFS transporter